MPTPRRTAMTILIAAAWATLLFRSFYQHRDAPMYDFAPTYVAATMVGDGDLRAHIYDRHAARFNVVPPGPFAEAARAAGFDRVPTPYVYPPFYAWLLVPLTALPWDAAKAVLLAALALALIAGLAFARRVAAPAVPPAAVFLVAPILLLFFTPLDYNNHLGQISTVIFALVGLSLFLANRGRATPAGIVLGLCIAVKLQPLGVVLLLLLRRRFRVAAAAGATVAALLLASGMVSGFDVLGRYVASVAGVASQGSLAAWNNQTITGLLLRATHPAAEIFQWRYLPAAWWMTALQLAVAGGLVAWVMRAAPPPAAPDDYTVSYLGGVLVSLIAPPIVWSHASVLLLLPVLWLGAAVAQVAPLRRRVQWLAALAVAWTLTALDVQAIALDLFEPASRVDGGARSLLCSANLFGLLATALLFARALGRPGAAR